MKEDASPDFENYTKTSTVYDVTRHPVGIDYMVEQLLALEKEGRLTGLDVGSGTGNHPLELKAKLPNLDLTLLEFNDGMFAQLSSKVAKNHADIKVQQGSVLNMVQFKDNSFDFVMMTQVLHHITAEGLDQDSVVTKVIDRKSVV